MAEFNDLAHLTQGRVHMQWDVRVPLRDGIHLSATLYTPQDCKSPAPAIFTLTPYIGQTYHDRGLYFAAHGYPFLTVDVRGRGNSEGIFDPHINEGKDGHDIVEWLARQPYCNGKVAMWGGSYGGLDQWNTAAQLPPHFATIVPVASPFFGVDFPVRSNIPSTYLMQWLTLVSGRTSQEKIFYDNQAFWNGRFRQWFESGFPFKDLDTFLGNPSAVFQEWVAHPYHDAYWDSYSPSEEHYARIRMPILTITGSYDDDQLGALMHYRRHLSSISTQGRTQHYLVIGPWDHAGTRTPQREFGGIQCGPQSCVDLGRLHVEWFAWTMQGGPKPAFLQQNVAYYVMGAEKWRYADTLEEVTARFQALYLDSRGDAVDVFRSGWLTEETPVQSVPDTYVYDPRDVTHSALESTIDPHSYVDQRMVHALTGKQLVYHSAPIERDAEISGFFKLSLWLAIDQPDTDFRACVYEITIDGRSVLLTSDWLRARYREGLREQKLIGTQAPLRYDFERFTFIARRISKGSRLRLVIGPINSIFFQKNYNGGGVVAEESMKDARAVVVRLFHDQSHPSALYIPFGKSEA